MYQHPSQYNQGNTPGQPVTGMQSQAQRPPYLTEMDQVTPHQQQTDGLTTPSNFHFQVNQEHRNDMIKELVQIQIYVREMEEINEVPQEADSTTVMLSQRNTEKNEETARQKEQEYHKKAIDQYRSDLQSQNRMGTVLHVKAMQRNLDSIYLSLCKEYLKKKKEQVRDFKHTYVTQMGQLVQQYNEIQVIPFINRFLQPLRNKISDFEQQMHARYDLSQELIMKNNERKIQCHKMESVKAILSMSQQDLLKHEYLKYRFKRLDEHFQWFQEQCNRVNKQIQENSAAQAHLARQQQQQQMVNPGRVAQQQPQFSTNPAAQSSQHAQAAQMAGSKRLYGYNQKEEDQAQAYKGQPYKAFRGDQNDRVGGGTTNTQQPSHQVANNREYGSGHEYARQGTMNTQKNSLTNQNQQPRTGRGDQAPAQQPQPQPNQDMLNLKQLVQKVHDLRKGMPTESEIKSLADIQKPGHPLSHQDGQSELQQHLSALTLENIERQRMEQDRSGILFSNILRQVRGRIQWRETLGTVENTNALYDRGQYGGGGGSAHGSGRGGGSHHRPEMSFFKTSTDQINYRQILGFEIRREEEEELAAQQQQQQIQQQQMQQQQVPPQYQQQAQVHQQTPQPAVQQQNLQPSSQLNTLQQQYGTDSCQQQQQMLRHGGNSLNKQHQVPIQGHHQYEVAPNAAAPEPPHPLQHAAQQPPQYEYHPEAMGLKHENSFGEHDRGAGQAPVHQNQPGYADAVEMQGAYSWFDQESQQVLDSLRLQFGSQVTMSVQRYPLFCNRQSLQWSPGQRDEELITLKQVQPKAGTATEIMFLIDYYSQCAFWFSEKDRQSGPNLQLNINDRFEMQDLIKKLTQRKFLKQQNS